MTKSFWSGAGERALKTFIQTFIATLGVGVGVVYTADDVRGLPWLSALITAAVAAILSVATSLGSPSFVAGPGPVVADDGVLMAPPAGDLDLIEAPDDDAGLIEPDDEDASDAVPRHGEE